MCIDGQYMYFNLCSRIFIYISRKISNRVYQTQLYSAFKLTKVDNVTDQT